MIGRTLSSYRVVEKLGEGGMGAVYLARDERLGRDVALKILPAGRLGDGAARSRFRKEAQALLRLSHPHVATLLDFGSEDGTDFLVMERVAGPTLDVAKRRGALPEKEVIRLGAQLARGLKAAHEAGVVHRDVKPSNLALTPDGLLKILDFGLARVEEGSKGPEEATETEPGAFVGTPAYMAPEQVRGEPADARTDVYGAGVVLYELATGRRLFEGRKGAELTSAILTQAPRSPSAIVPSVSSGLEAVILKALDKDPELRYQSARELLVDLERLVRGVPAPVADGARPTPDPRASRWRPRLVGAATVALVAIAAWQLWPARVPRVTQVTRIVGGLGKPPVAGWATDGVRLYYVGWQAGKSTLFQVPASGGEPAEITVPFGDIRGVFGYADQESALLVAGSETGQRVQRMQGVPLWLVPVPTGPPRRLGDLTGWSAALSPDGRRVAAYQTDGIVVARSDGSDARAVGGGALRPVSGRWVRWSPDGRSLRVKAAGPDGSRSWIWEVRLEGGQVLPLWPADRGAWTADGRYFILQLDEAGGDIYVVRESGLWPRRRSQPDRLTFGPLRFEAPGPSLDGRRLFAWGTIERPMLLRYDRSAGRFSPHLGGAAASEVAASLDGEWLAWIRPPDHTLWRGRADGTQRLQLTAPPLYAALPRWSPDGRRVLFAGAAPGRRLTWWLSADGGEPESLGGWPTGLVEGDQTDLWDPCWLPDGRTVVYSTQLAWQAGLFRMDVETREVSRLPGTEDLQFPKCGPRGQILAMVRPKTQGGPQETFRVLRAGRQQWEDVGPIAGASFANWSRDGESIIGLNEAARRIERRSLRSGRVEVLADVHELRLGTVSGTPWMGLGPDDAPLVTQDLSTSDLCALDWEAP